MPLDVTLDALRERVLAALRDPLTHELRGLLDEMERRQAAAADQAAAAANRALDVARQEAASALTVARESAAREIEAVRRAADAERRASELRSEEAQERLDATRTELEAARAEAGAAQQALETARTEADVSRGEAEAARTAIDAAQRQAEAARLEADAARRNADAARAAIDAVQRQAEAARAEAGTARGDLEAARAQEEAVRVEADEVRRDLEARLVQAHDTLDAARRDLEARREEGLARQRDAVERHGRIAAAFDRIVRATALGDILDLLAAEAAREAERAAVFVVRDGALRDVALSGFTVDDRPRGHRVQVPIDGATLLGRAVREGRPVVVHEDDGISEGLDRPAFAATGDRRAAAALPLVVGGRVVGVVYADGRLPMADPAWPGGLELLARHAGLLLEARTVEYAAGVRQPRPGAGPVAAPPA
jgi:hypothetical protein